MEVMDMVFGDVRRGKLKPNLLPNLPLKLLPNLVTSMAMDMDLDTDTMADTTDLDIVVTMDVDIFGDVRRGRLKPNPLPNLPPKALPILTFTMDMDMDTMAVTMDVDIFGDVRRGKLKPNLLPNLLRIRTSTTDMDMDSAMVDTMDMALDTMDMVLDTMDAATIGENKSQIHQAHYQHSASKCLHGNNDDLSFCCRTHSL